MSNKHKLVKKSPKYEETKIWLRAKIETEGGVNITPELIRECNVEVLKEELYDILADLTEEGYQLFKVSKVCKGEETRGLMMCDRTTTLAFTKVLKDSDS